MYVYDFGELTTEVEPRTDSYCTVSLKSSEFYSIQLGGICGLKSYNFNQGQSTTTCTAASVSSMLVNIFVAIFRHKKITHHILIPKLNKWIANESRSNMNVAADQ